MHESIDTQIFFLLNTGAVNSLCDSLMPALSARGYLLAFPVLVLVIDAAVRVREDLRPMSLQSLLIVIVMPIALFFFADLTSNFLKDIIARPRPCRTLEGVRLLVPCLRSFSMPSGHATDSFAYAVSLVILARNAISRFWRIYLLMLAASIAVSRVYVGVHYPSDIAAGAVLGSGMAIIVSVPFRRFLHHPPGQDRMCR
jgi:undecaprenyl-diphosphatase